MWYLLDQLGGIHLERTERFCRSGQRDAEILADVACGVKSLIFGMCSGPIGCYNRLQVQAGRSSFPHLLERPGFPVAPIHLTDVAVRVPGRGIVRGISAYSRAFCKKCAVWRMRKVSASHTLTSIVRARVLAPLGPARTFS